MVLNKSNMNYWIMTGFKLGRLEFLWGSTMQEAVEVFDSSKREILQMIGSEVPVDKSDFQSFCNSIIYYYMRNDTEVLSMILIGVCTQRCMLVGASADEKYNETLKELAKSSINSLPDSVIDDKDLLFSVIWKNRSKDTYSIASAIYDAFFATHNTSFVNPVCCATDKYFFISYSSLDKDIALNLKELLEENGIKCWMAPDSIPVGSDYTEVIVDAIEKSCGVVLMLSENSQNSKWVPKELDIAITADKVIFPIHIDRSAIVNKLRFRLSDSQIIEAYGDVSSIVSELLYSLKKHIQ